MEKTIKNNRNIDLQVEAANYNLITDIASKLSVMKGYEAAYSNPRKGKLLVNKDGVNYIVEVTPLLQDNDLSLFEVMDKISYVFK